MIYRVVKPDIKKPYFENFVSIISFNDLETSYLSILELLFNTQLYTPVTDDKNYDILENPYEIDENLLSDIVQLEKMLDPDFFYRPEYFMKTNLLELLIVLSINMEDHIMEDEVYGDRTGQWFWEMIDNLDLLDEPYLDSNLTSVSLSYAKSIILKFLSRDYNPDGSYGNIFIIPGCPQDLAKVNLWTQANWYLSYKIDNNEI